MIEVRRRRKLTEVVYRCLLCGKGPGGDTHGPNGHEALLYSEQEDVPSQFVTVKRG